MSQSSPAVAKLPQAVPVQSARTKGRMRCIRELRAIELVKAVQAIGRFNRDRGAGVKRVVFR